MGYWMQGDERRYGDYAEKHGHYPHAEFQRCSECDHLPKPQMCGRCREKCRDFVSVRMDGFRKDKGGL